MGIRVYFSILMGRTEQERHKHAGRRCRPRIVCLLNFCNVTLR